MFAAGGTSPRILPRGWKLGNRVPQLAGPGILAVVDPNFWIKDRSRIGYRLILDFV
jgi:hypothetical protein